MNDLAPTLDNPLQTEVVALSTVGKDFSFVDAFVFLMHKKRSIALITAALTSAGAIAILLLPPSYAAEATILPPQQAQSSLAAMVAVGAGAMAGAVPSGMASQLGLKNPADLYIGILKSRSIADVIVDHFHLKEVYRKKLRSEALTELSKHSSFASGKDTLITINVKDVDPRRAAAIANAYVGELHSLNSRLALTDSSQRRLFFENQLRAEKDALANAEVALKATQQSTGLLAPAGQAEALIKSEAQLRAEIASRRVGLEAMRSYATEANPKIEILKHEISALESQLRQTEASGSGSKLDVPGNKMPEASLEYIRKMRDLRYHETLFELLARQYEAARIDEAKQAPVIQVVDRAVVPDKQSRPSRILLGLGVLLISFVFASLFLYVQETIRKLHSHVKTVMAESPAIY